MANFTGRDLALLLPDKFDVRNAEGEKDTFEPLKPKIDQTKRVTRYFPGKAPVWVGPEGNICYDSFDFSRILFVSSQWNNFIRDMADASRKLFVA